MFKNPNWREANQLAIYKRSRRTHTPTKVVCSHCDLVLLKGIPFWDGQKTYMPKETTPFYFDSYWLLEGKLNIQYFALTSKCNYLIEN